MNIPLRRLAELVDARLVGDPDACCVGASPPGETLPGHVTMLDDPRRAADLRDEPAIAVVTAEMADFGPKSQLVVSDPHRAFAAIVGRFRPPLDDTMPGLGIDPSASIHPTARVHPSAMIGPDVRIGAGVRIYPGVVVMPRCEIGDDCVLHPNVTLYEYTRLHRRVVIHAGSVLGAHGFGYRQSEGRHQPTPQLGYVEVESDVELGACVTIDRGTYGKTRIGAGTKVDNQVMIGHNCHIGRHNLICSQVGIAGSCRTGDYVVLAGQVGLKDHITLGDQVIVGAQAGVMEDCEPRQTYLGSPATKQREQMQIMALQRRLPEIRRTLKEQGRELKEQGRELSELGEQVRDRRRAA